MPVRPWCPGGGRRRGEGLGTLLDEETHASARSSHGCWGLRLIGQGKIPRRARQGRQAGSAAFGAPPLHRARALWPLGTFPREARCIGSGGAQSARAGRGSSAQARQCHTRERAGGRCLAPHRPEEDLEALFCLTLPYSVPPAVHLNLQGGRLGLRASGGAGRPVSGARGRVARPGQADNHTWVGHPLGVRFLKMSTSRSTTFSSSRPAIARAARSGASGRPRGGGLAPAHVPPTRLACTRTPRLAARAESYPDADPKRSTENAGEWPSEAGSTPAVPAVRDTRNSGRF